MHTPVPTWPGMNHLYEKNQEETQSSQAEKRRDQYLHPGSLPQALPPGRERPEREKPKLSAKGGWSREQENDVNKILDWKQIDEILAFSPLLSVHGGERSELSRDSIFANGASSISKTGARGGRNLADGLKVLWKGLPPIPGEEVCTFLNTSSLPHPCHQMETPKASVAQESGYPNSPAPLPLFCSQNTGSQPPGREFEGSFSRKLTGLKELTYLFWHFEAPTSRPEPYPILDLWDLPRNQLRIHTGSHSAVKRIPLTEDWTATIQSHLREALTTKKETKTNKQKKKKKKERNPRKQR